MALIIRMLNKFLHVRIVISFFKKSVETDLAELLQDLIQMDQMAETGNNPLQFTANMRIY